MTNSRSALKTPALAVLAGFLALYAGPTAQAQNQEIQPGAADGAAAREATRLNLHPMLANTPAAAKYGSEADPSKKPPSPAGPFQPGRPRFPGDLSFQGGPVVDHVQSHDLYVLNNAVNCTKPGCWGDPEGFLQDLGKSDFIHVTDQYVGRHDDNRYTLGAGALISTTLPKTPLTDLDMLAVVHAVASQTHQTGYNHVYHVFLPPGTDECFDSTFTTCYSPDKPSTFFFCAYHSSVDFKDIGHILYSVQPFQNVDGCNLAPGSPNGPLADSTDSTLSHELIETITDPDGTGWWNTASNVLFGEEIADECSFLIFLPKGVFFDPPAFKIGDHRYAVQSEYGNSAHACVTGPGGNSGDN